MQAITKNLQQNSCGFYRITCQFVGRSLINQPDGMCVIGVNELRRIFMRKVSSFEYVLQRGSLLRTADQEDYVPGLIDERRGHCYAIHALLGHIDFTHQAFTFTQHGGMWKE